MRQAEGMSGLRLLRARRRAGIARRGAGILVTAVSLALAGCAAPADPEPAPTERSPTPAQRSPALSPRPSPAPSPQVAILYAAGDIASCGSRGDEATAALLGNSGVVATLGDAVYPDGSARDFAECYASSWGRHRSRTRPAPGNHEYQTAGARAYFRYFGAAAGDPRRGYYSYDLGAWHVVVLNSNCGAVGGCDRGSPQERWLRADLARSRRACTLAYWHHPLFTSGAVHPGAGWMRPIFRALHDAGAEVALTGHNHQYERFAPQTANGKADRDRGVRQFVVGTGGASHYRFGETQPHSEVRDASAYGVLRLTLRPDGYAWRFLPARRGGFTDAGAGRCH